MKCVKCKSPMIVEGCIEMETDAGEDTGQLWLSVWHCVNCNQNRKPGLIRHWLKPRSEVVHPTKRFRSGKPALKTAISVRLSA